MTAAWHGTQLKKWDMIPVGFLLLRYSVLPTVDFLSLIYLFFISWFICSRRWCIGKLGVFHGNQTSMCLAKGEVGAPLHRFKPSSKIFTDRSEALLLLWIFNMFFSVLCLPCLCARLFVWASWSPAVKGLAYLLSFVVSNCEFVTFPLVSWVRCGTWLFRFLIFAPLLT